jgi:hypothetical protein
MDGMDMEEVIGAAKGEKFAKRRLGDANPLSDSGCVL